MRTLTILLFSLSFLLFSAQRVHSQSQPVDPDQLGAWYMYFYNWAPTSSSWGLQGDLQYRNWNLLGDLEQLLIRSAIHYRPSASTTLASGYAHITTGHFDSEEILNRENRIYQEYLGKHSLCISAQVLHRFRYEQRWVGETPFRTRWRYSVQINWPLTNNEIGKGIPYISVSNELFLNGFWGRDEDGNHLPLFDRNRLYLGLGYGLTDHLNLQVGMMNQAILKYDKFQAQFSLIQNI